jgi:hypothetical protein
MEVRYNHPSPVVMTGLLGTEGLIWCSDWRDSGSTGPTAGLRRALHFELISFSSRGEAREFRWYTVRWKSKMLVQTTSMRLSYA